MMKGLLLGSFVQPSKGFVCSYGDEKPPGWASVTYLNKQTCCRSTCFMMLSHYVAFALTDVSGRSLEVRVQDGHRFKTHHCLLVAVGGP